MSDIRLTISHNIKKYRVQRNQSQEELAYKSKISAAHLSKIERGDHNITITTPCTDCRRASGRIDSPSQR